MIELTTKAENYAAEKTNELMTKAIAQAYADGYRDGYKDREEEIPVDLRDNKTEYIDLGLPSGTMWAADYYKKDENIQYLPYERAALLNIPTKEQWEELINCCKWEHDYEMKETRCVGPNGIELRFTQTGMICAEKIVKGSYGKSLFWIHNDEKSITMDADASHIYFNNVPYHRTIVKVIQKVFSGYKLPIRLVRTE